MEKNSEKPRIRLEEFEYTDLVLQNKKIPPDFGTICPIKEWTFKYIATGSPVEFKVLGVDERFIKLYGTLKSVELHSAVFNNLNGLVNVKVKINKGVPVIVDYGNKIYVSSIIDYKNQLLTLQNPPVKVIRRSDKRIEDRLDCGIQVQIKIDQRNIAMEKNAVVRDISFRGCCIAVEKTKDEQSTGFSVGKNITVVLDLKSRNQRISISGVIRNIRKDSNHENIRLAGIEFGALSPEASEMIDAIVNRLKSMVLS
jgi:c-di-GMP-binding flagellar brake protein YcgR